MKDAFHITEDDLLQYALGSLKETQLGTMTAHISMCNECRGELAKMQVELASYAAAIPMVEVPYGAKERFLQRLNVETAPESKFVQMRNKNRAYQTIRAVQQWLESPIPFRILSGALAAGLVFAVYDDLSNIHKIRSLVPQMERYERDVSQLAELKQFLHGENAQQVTLREKPLQIRAPEGHTLYSAASGKLVFTASNMPAPPAGKAYELWVLPAHGGAPLPAGMFTPDLQGNAAVIFPEIPQNVQASGFGVTLEKAEGSPAPTSEILISGQ